MVPGLVTIEAIRKPLISHKFFALGSCTEKNVPWLSCSCQHFSDGGQSKTTFDQRHYSYKEEPFERAPVDFFL